jgi:hypothetical protein
MLSLVIDRRSTGANGKMNAVPRKGDWMQTYTGLAFWPLDPQPDEIRILDIAQALSKLCRYGGHCRRFYSVAEHSVLVASKAPDHLKLSALMHDASEAYVIDVPRPLKPWLPGYAEIEDRVEQAIAARFNLPWPLSEEIKQLDERIIEDEREQNMSEPPRFWGHREPLGVTLKCWSPQTASAKFMTAFQNYGGRL